MKSLKKCFSLFVMLAVFFGIMQFSVSSGSFTKGDVDTDGKVTTNDAKIALEASLRLRELSDESFLLADIDGSGEITSTDAHSILLYALSDGIQTNNSLACYETRAVWVAINAGDFPSCDNLSAAKLKSEIDTVVENAAIYGFNTIFYQVRSHSDAMYYSDIFPTSTVLVENQGDTAPMDTLAYFVEKAHSMDIELHAWINPYRITSATHSTASLAATNPAVLHPEWTVKSFDAKGKETGLWYNPALPEVRKLITDGIAEIVSNYAVDGIHFDDYFYPYENAKNFDDADEYALYGNGMALADWRRENVNLLVKSAYETVHTYNPEAEFGISPFGVWATAYTDRTYGTTGLGNPLESYKDIYADSRAWVVNGWVDYICPQLYWSIDNAVCPFETLVDWWDALCSQYGVKLYIGIAAYRGSESGSFSSPSEILNELEYLQSTAACDGYCIFSYKSVLNNLAQIQATLATVNSESYGSGEQTEDRLYSVIEDKSDLMLRLGNTDAYGPTKYVMAAKGMIETVVSRTVFENVEYSLLSNGYYIASSNIAPVENEKLDKTRVTRLSLSSNEDYSDFVIRCSNNVSMTVWLDTAYAEVTLYHIENAQTLLAFAVKDNPLFSNMTVTADGETVRIRFDYKAEYHIYGYLSRYENGQAVISFKNPVTLAEGDKPMQDILISIDPGHSYDSGASVKYNGVRYNEYEFNYAMARIVKENLEALGATVVMSYEYENHGEEDVAAIISRFRELSPDANVSIHCNWVERTTVNGTEAWWCYNNSNLLAQVMAKTSTDTDGLTFLGAKKGYYKVSRFNDFPSILFESMYMSNASDMAYMTSENGISLVAQGITDGLVEFFRQQGGVE